MNKSYDQILSILEKVKIEGAIDWQRLPPESDFSRQLLSCLPEEGEAGDMARQICSAMEYLLVRSHVDSRLLIDLCAALKTLSELPFPKLLKNFDKALRMLQVPVGSWIAKNMRAARVIDSHPTLAELSDVESLCALEKLPEGSFERPDAAGPLIVGDEKLDLRSAGKKEIVSAVRKVKSEIAKKKKEAQAALEEEVASDQESPAMARQGAELDPEAVMDVVAGECDVTLPTKVQEEKPAGSLASELSEAELVISRLLSALAKDERLQELTSALENTRALMAHARADLQGPVPSDQHSQFLQDEMSH
ncbi:MAG: hypothetical protein ACOH5I_18115 [Oligoflexus sp.]